MTVLTSVIFYLLMYTGEVDYFMQAYAVIDTIKILYICGLYVYTILLSVLRELDFTGKYVKIYTGRIPSALTGLPQQRSKKLTEIRKLWITLLNATTIVNTIHVLSIIRQANTLKRTTLAAILMKNLSFFSLTVVVDLLVDSVAHKYCCTATTYS